MRNNLSGFIIVITLILFLAPSTLIAEKRNILGRWCDQMIPNSNKFNRIITIYLSKDGIPWASSKFYDGSAGKRKLADLGKGMFKVIGSSVGDKYRIVPNTGELQLLDNDGFIRTAKRLETSSRPRDCLP